MINDNNNNNELEIMRTQLNALKSQLAQQEIVTENLIIDAMKKKMTWIKKYVIFQICLIPILAIIWAAIIPMCGISWWNYAFLLIMCCIDVYADYRINVTALSDDDYLRGNLVSTVKKLLKMKRYRALQMAICIPLIIVWLLWAGIEAYNALPEATSEFQEAFISGGLIGGVIGGICGLIFAFSIYRKMQRTNDEVIAQINDLTKPEE
ncbi:MAG: hypothetical protein ACI31B_05150 [Muribaculaceae bacterium]